MPDELDLKIVLLVLEPAFLLLGGVFLWGWYQLPDFAIPAILGLLFLFNAVSLFKRWRVGRTTTVVTLWLIFLITVFGTINPFNASHLSVGGNEPHSLGELLMVVIPAGLAILWFIHVLGKYKGHFGKRATA